jgi:hypothetical protein
VAGKPPRREFAPPWPSSGQAPSRRPVGDLLVEDVPKGPADDTLADPREEAAWPWTTAGSSPRFAGSMAHLISAYFHGTSAPKAACGGDFSLRANSMTGEQHDTAVRMSWAFRGRSVGAQAGPSRDRLHKRADEGVLDPAVTEDRAVVGPNPSAAAAQGQGRRCASVRRLTLYPVSGPMRQIPGVWGQSPQSLEGHCAVGSLVTLAKARVALRM